MQRTQLQCKYVNGRIIDGRTCTKSTIKWIGKLLSRCFLVHLKINDYEKLTLECNDFLSKDEEQIVDK